MKTITRSEQKLEDTWDLDSLFPSEKEWGDALSQLQKRIEQAPTLKGELKKSKDSFLFVMQWYEETAILTENIFNWASLNYNADASNTTNVERYSLAYSAYSQLAEAMAYFDPELLSIEDSVIEKYLQDPAFSPYATYIKKALRFKEHVLGEAEERLLALQSEASSVSRNTFNDLTNVDFDFGTIEGKPLTQSSFSSFLMQEDRALREQAYKQLYGVYDSCKHAIARLYEGQVKQDIFRTKARKYASCRQMALYGDDVPLSVYDNLIKQVHESLPTLHRYYALRAKNLGLPKLAHWDVYVPLLKGVKSHTPYEEAANLIAKALLPLGNEYVNTLKAGLLEQR
ncbi:MAG: oligoendopeptidase F, partial [Spirochaetia bacterium]|nr:oligoendopeptidase F [Spirochaetia bacterium]